MIFAFLCASPISIGLSSILTRSGHCPFTNSSMKHLFKHKQIHLSTYLAFFFVLAINLFLINSAFADTEILRPNTFGDYAQLYVSPSGSNYTLVDDVTSDGDSTLVYNSNNFINDAYNLTDHSAGSGTINSVTLYIVAAHYSAPYDLMAQIKTNGSWDYSNSVTVDSSAYQTFSWQYTTNPNTSSAWTWTEIDALQAGPYCIGGYIKITQVYVEVDYTPDAGGGGEGDPVFPPDVTETMMIWGTNSTTSGYSIWDPDTSEWPAGTAGPFTLVDPYNVIIRSNPARNEKIAVFQKGGTNPTLHVSIYDGETGTWGTVKDLGAISNQSYRCFDAAVETYSGQVVIAASTGTDFKYWVWDGSTWIVDGSTSGLSLGSDTKYWMRMAAQPNGNELAIIMTGYSARDVYGAIWDGDSNTWGNAYQLETSNTQSYYKDSIDVEYIEGGDLAGQAMFVWCTSSYNIQSRLWTGSAWATSEQTSGSFSAYGEWLSLASDPNSSRMALAVTDSVDDIQVLIWNGSWSSSSPWQTEATGNAYTAGWRRADVIFESKEGHESDLLVAYAYNNSSTGMRYKHADWNGSTYVWGNEGTLSSSYVRYWVQMERTRDGTVLLATRGSLNTWSWDGSSWSSEGALTNDLESSTSAVHPFCMTQTLPLVLPKAGVEQTHYRWRNDDGGEGGEEITLAVDSASSNYITSGSQITTSHTVSGTNRLLLVGVSITAYNTLRSVSSVTWNGTESLTYVGSREYSTRARIEIFKLVAPSTGAFNVVVNLNSSLATNSSATVGVVSFTGADQVTPLGTFASASSYNTSANVTVASDTDEIVFGVVASRIYGLSSFAGDERWNTSPEYYSDAAGGTITGASPSKAISWTITSHAYWAIGGISVKPATGDASATWFANEDTKPTGFPRSTTKRLRLQLSNPDGMSSYSRQYQLQVAQATTCSAGTFAAVPTDSSGAWQIVDTTYFDDGDDSANIANGLSDPGGGTFTTGILKDAEDTTDYILLEENEYTEIEFALQATSSATAGGDYCFRLYDTQNSAELGSYTEYAQASIASTTFSQNHYRWRHNNGIESGSGPATHHGGRHLGRLCSEH